jgi:peptidoglycan/xylan/chitin deacetylase (PgdA/CDA1 family)
MHRSARVLQALFLITLLATPALAQHVCEADLMPRPAPLAITFGDAPLAASYSCDPGACLPPDCHCASTDPPGGLAPADIPQFVLLTYDDCVDANTQPIREALEAGLTNPDGRPIPATFFVSVVNCWAGRATTDATFIQELYLGGHEMASHTHSHQTGTGTTLEEWLIELDSTKDFLTQEAGVLPAHVQGFRAPYVATNQAMFEALRQRGYTYDSSLLEQPLFQFSMSTGQDRYVWPHTFDHGTPISCGFFPSNDCPTEPVAGLWNVPLYYYTDPRGEDAPADSLYYGAFDPGAPLSGGPLLAGEDLLAILRWNFEQRYEGNRAPINLYLHASQLTEPERRETLRTFAQEILAKDDVWAITMTGLLEWMQAPVPANAMADWYEEYCTRYPCAAPVSTAPDPTGTVHATAYPNPAAGHVTLSVNHPGAAHARVEVFDVMGRRVLVEHVDLPAGAAEIRLSTASLSPGVYVYRVQAGEERMTGRFTRM